jgi:glycosyltransferase involved in cell wall biosynthesis
MNVAFCIPQFKAANLPLQPWLTVYRVAMSLRDRGDKVHVITDEGASEELDRIHINVVDSLRGTNSKQIRRQIQSIEPDYVIVTVTPLSLATACWYQILDRYKAYGYLSYPFYTCKQILKAFPYICLRDRLEYGRHILVPKRTWADRLVRIFDAVICQSTHTVQQIASLTKSKIHAYAIPPGIDMDRWASEISPKPIHSNGYFLYLGAASRIRGFRLLLDAFSRISDSDIRLKILARGADETKLNEIKNAVARYNLNNRVTVQGGWVETDEIKKQIQSAAAVLFPFVLVPSEFPVSVLEAIYCGTPVVISDLVNLPQALCDAAIVVPHADVQKLASTIQKFHRQKEYQVELLAACNRLRKSIRTWESVCKEWQYFLTR